MRVLRNFLYIIDTISEWIGKAVSVLPLAMVLVLSYEVVSRYVFNKPTIWAQDIVIFMFGYTGLLAGAYALKHGDHINVDFLYERLSPRKRAILDIFNGLLGFFFLILVIVMDWDPAINALANHQRTASDWAPPIGHFKLMIPIGGFLFLMQGLANWIRTLYFVVTKKEFEMCL